MSCLSVAAMVAIVYTLARSEEQVRSLEVYRIRFEAKSGRFVRELSKELVPKKYLSLRTFILYIFPQAWYLPLFLFFSVIFVVRGPRWLLACCHDSAASAASLYVNVSGALASSLASFAATLKTRKVISPMSEVLLFSIPSIVCLGLSMVFIAKNGVFMG